LRAMPADVAAQGKYRLRKHGYQRIRDVKLAIRSPTGQADARS
jgi:hypothetical protein